MRKYRASLKPFTFVCERIQNIFKRAATVKKCPSVCGSRWQYKALTLQPSVFRIPKSTPYCSFFFFGGEDISDCLSRTS